MKELVNKYPKFLMLLFKEFKQANYSLKKLTNSLSNELIISFFIKFIILDFLNNILKS